MGNYNLNPFYIFAFTPQDLKHSYCTAAGIVFSDGKLWQKQRKFSLQHLRNFGFGRREMEEKIQEETRDLIAIFNSRGSEPIFMHTAFDVSVLNVLWAMMAGERFEIEDVRLIKLLQIIHDAFRLTDMSGGMLNQMPFLRHIAPDVSGYTQTVSVLTRMWEFLEVWNDLHFWSQKIESNLVFRKRLRNTGRRFVRRTRGIWSMRFYRKWTWKTMDHLPVGFFFLNYYSE